MDDTSWKHVSMSEAPSAIPPVIGAVFIVAMGYALYMAAKIGGLATILIPSGTVYLIMTTLAFFRIFDQGKNIAVSLDRAWKWHRRLMYLKIVEAVAVIGIGAGLFFFRAGIGAEPPHPEVIRLILVPSVIALMAFFVMTRIAARPDTDDAEMSFAIGSCRGQPQIASLGTIGVMYLLSTVIVCVFCAIGWPARIDPIIIGLNISHVLFAAIVCVRHLNGSFMFGERVSTRFGHGIMTWTVKSRESHDIRKMMQSGPDKEVFAGTNIDLTITRQNLFLLVKGKMVSGENEYWYVSNNGSMDDKAIAAIDILSGYAEQHTASLFTQTITEQKARINFHAG